MIIILILMIVFISVCMGLYACVARENLAWVQTSPILYYLLHAFSVCSKEIGISMQAREIVRLKINNTVTYFY